MKAHAYAQGNDIHLAPGQEKHLPHEAWHTVQQKQGRVQSTAQLKGKTNINDDPALEKEADLMGNSASKGKASINVNSLLGKKADLTGNSASSMPIQRYGLEDEWSVDDC